MKSASLMASLRVDGGYLPRREVSATTCICEGCLRRGDKNVSETILCPTCGGALSAGGSICAVCNPGADAGDSEATTEAAIDLAQLQAIAEPTPALRPPPPPPPPRPKANARPPTQRPAPVAFEKPRLPQSATPPSLQAGPGQARPPSRRTLPMSPLVAQFLGAEEGVPIVPIIDCERIVEPDAEFDLRAPEPTLGRPGDDDLAADEPLRAAIALQQQGRMAESIALLEQAVKSAPNASRLLNRLALTLLGERRDYAEAERLLRRALEIVPNHPSYQKNLALVLSEAAKSARGGK